MRDRQDKGHHSDRRPAGLFIDKIENISLQSGRPGPLLFSSFSLLFVVAGELRIRAGQEVYVSDGSGILLYPGEEVFAETGAGEGCQYIRVSFDGGSARDIVEYLGMEPLLLFSFGSASVTAALDNMMTCQAAGEYFRAAIHLQILLVSVMEGRETDSRESDLQQIYDYMMEHFQETLDLTSLAAMYGTSVSYFSRRFRQTYGESPIQFLNKVRITNARLLLETTRMKVREISDICGFDKPEYFCFVFKKQEGCTPTQFRVNRKRLT